MENLADNPFAVQTPEGISAEDAIELFVDVFTDFFQVINPGHTFLNGPRGSGKSMMFRYMLPDCQYLKLNNAPISEHDYFAVYVPVKQTGLNTVDLQRIHKHANFLLNEHLLVTYISRKIFNSLASLFGPNPLAFAKPGEIIDYYHYFIEKATECGYQGAVNPLPPSAAPARVFKEIEDVCKSLYNDVWRYIKLLSFTTDLPPYTNSLCEYLEFLYPLLERLKTLSFMPQKPVFLLIDDADNLTLTQTIILNSWVSQRTTSVVSLKISTQLNYQTHRTTSGITIDAPHDFHEVDISSVYTSRRSFYKKRISAIVEKRLESFYKKKIEAEFFFPEDEKQKARIEDFAKKIRLGEVDTPNAYRDNDKSYRYATSEYLKSLRGKSKSGMTFRYAGFRDVVDMSSGIIRHFLELSSLMYSTKQAEEGMKPIEQIDISTQNEIIRDYSEEFLHKELDKIASDEAAIGSVSGEQLKNLIHSMGGMFQVILYSDASQRRVFSIALTDAPEPDIEAVLKLGVRYGYLHQSTISKREGTGRTKRYTLSRRLAPSFQLIAQSFAGDQFIGNDDLRAAMRDSKSFVSSFKRRKLYAQPSSPQQSLFSTYEEDE